MTSQNIVVYISHEGGEVADLQDLVDDKEVQLDWIGTLNGEDVPVKVRLAETDAGDRCRHCGTPLVDDASASYGVSGTDGSLCCDRLIKGCGACDDGEAHPHERAIAPLELIDMRLEDVEIRWSDDSAKQDPELICPRCDEAICDVEHGDSLGLLARTVLGHLNQKCKKA